MGCPSQFLIHLWPFQKLSEELLQILKSCLKILPEGARVRKFAGLEAGDKLSEQGVDYDFRCCMYNPGGLHRCHGASEALVERIGTLGEISGTS